MYDALQEPPPRENLRRMVESLDETGMETAWQRFVWVLTPNAIEKAIAYMLLALFTPAVDAFENSIHRSRCAENMHRLALAIMLYRLEHGSLPDEDWVAQIKPYLGDNPEQYFLCPSNVAPKGKTTYVMIQYGDSVPKGHEIILLLEQKTPVPFDKAVISSEAAWELRVERQPFFRNTADLRNMLRNVEGIDHEVIEKHLAENPPEEQKPEVDFSLEFDARQVSITPHPGGMNTARQSGAVLFVNVAIEEEELLRLLGRE